MKYYFTLIGDDYRTDKNKLEAAAKEAFRDASHCIISENEIEFFKKELIERIHELNAKFSRCKPLNPYVFKYHIDAKTAIFIDGICSLSFYEAKNEA